MHIPTTTHTPSHKATWQVWVHGKLNGNGRAVAGWGPRPRAHTEPSARVAEHFQQEMANGFSHGGGSG